MTVRKEVRYYADDFPLTFEPVFEDEINVIKAKDGYKVTYLTYADAVNPREWDNLGKMVCFHGRYDLGDEHDYRKEDYSSWDELAQDIYKKENVVEMFSLYLYDHSGLALKIGSFSGLLPQGHAEFDSGQVGFIYVTKERLKELGAKKKDIEKCLQEEIEQYNGYINGECYSLITEFYDNKKRPIDFENCGDYYGVSAAIDAINKGVS